jgi:hypothetical protein
MHNKVIQVGDVFSWNEEKKFTNDFIITELHSQYEGKGIDLVSKKETCWSGHVLLSHFWKLVKRNNKTICANCNHEK